MIHRQGAWKLSIWDIRSSIRSQDSLPYSRTLNTNEFRKESFSDSDSVLDVHKFLSVQKVPHAFPFLTLKSCPEDRMKKPRYLKSLTNSRGFPSSL